MTGPVWLSWSFAGLMTVSSLFHGARLLAARRRGRGHPYDADATHLLMSGAMAVMLLLPAGARPGGAWSLLVVVPALWFGRSAVRSFVAAGAGAVAAPARQLLMCLTMLFMLAVAGGPATSAAATMPGTDMAGMDMSGAAPSGATPAAVLPVLLLGLLALAGGWHAREITRAVASGDAWHLRGPTGESGARHLLLARGPSLGCQLAMTAAMGFMLVPMVR